jgi:hypothetical protein
METQSTGVVLACVSLEGTAINYRGDLEKLAVGFVNALAQFLRKKGVTLELRPTAENTTLQIRFVEIEQCNQLLRYLMPFTSPAFVEIEAEFASGRAPAELLPYRQTAHFGLFGGSAAGMLGVCVDRLAEKLGKDVLKRLA